MDTPISGFVRAGSLEELKAKGRLVVHGPHRPILVIHDKDRVFALDNRCPHKKWPKSNCKPPAVPVALLVFVRQSASASLRDQIESEDSRSCGSTTVSSAVAARAPAGNCSTVARWPSHKRVTSTSCPSPGCPY